MPKKVMEDSSTTKVKKQLKNVSELEETLVRNLVELQKVHADLAEKFDNLAKEISELLALFELTARNFAKHTPIGEFEKDKEFLEKIDKLLDQNKTLAKGLMLMEERLRERVYGGSAPHSPQVQMPRPQMQQNRQQPPQSQIPQAPEAPTEEINKDNQFQASISTRRPLPRF